MQDTFLDAINQRYNDILSDMDKTGLSGKTIMDDLTAKYIEAKCLSGGKPFPTFLKPAFLSATQIQTVRRVTNVIMSCLEKVSDLYFEGPELPAALRNAKGRGNGTG